MAVLAISHIIETPGICGGKPRIDGTRITVEALALFINNPDWTVEDIAEDFGLTPAQVYAAWSYYLDHQDEIEAQHQQAEEATPTLAGR